VQGRAKASFRQPWAACVALAAALSVTVPSPAPAQVYKWVDEDGVITFSNIAPPENQDYQVLRFPCYAADPKCRSVAWEKVPLNVRSFRNEIRLAADLNAVDESLIRAIIHAESAYQPDARSPKGAQGLMQLMPQTARRYGVSDPFDAWQNLQAGATHLRGLIEEFEGNLTLALAAYNAGAGAVRRHGGVPDFPETQEYVQRVYTRLGRRPGPAALGPARRQSATTVESVRMVRQTDGSLLLQN
jgi:soluble lytic murein transglycosylase-like protein